MSLETLSFILGAVLVLAGILGGGFELKELKIPKVSGKPRAIAVMVGLAFIGLAFISPGLQKNRMGSMEWAIDRLGLNYHDYDLSIDDPKPCQEACEKDSQCKAWTYVKPNQGSRPHCWLKSITPPPQSNNLCVSGTKIE